MAIGTESMLSKARMDRMVTKWNADYEAALRALHLEDCLPCRGRGWVPASTIDLPSLRAEMYKNGRRCETEGGWSSVTCTLCKGEGRILPPGCYGRLVVAKNPFPDESTGVKILAHKSRHGIKAIGWPITRPPPTTTIGWYKPRSYWDTGL